MGIDIRRLTLHRGAILVTLILTTALGALADDAANAPAAAADPIYDNAVLTGEEISTFKDGDASGWVVQGAFSLKLGERTLSGNDAVIWVRDYQVGAADRHDVILYIEGGAKIDEPGGLTSEDKVFLATFHNQGAITTEGAAPQQRDVSSLPLYARALVARKEAAAREKALAANTVRPAPPLVLKTPGVAEGKTPEAAADQPPVVEGPTTTEPPAETPEELPAAVFFHADKFGSSVSGEGDRRLTVARGHVYLAQGAPDSAEFIELRSQDAVIVSRPLKEGETAPEKESRHPASPKMGQGAREVIVGVYLEGDVVISRGARFLRGPKAYYDFNSDRAIIPNAVFRSEQTQRNIPVVVRADEIRMLSAREMTFRNAKVSSSDFYTPSYHIGARRVYMMDTTPYDEKGKALSRQRWLTKLQGTTFSARGVPLLYWPYLRTELERGHTALRKASVGFDSSKGFGVETQWHLFRLLGLIEPEGVEARLNLDFYEREPTAGIEYDYERENYTGYGVISGSYNRDEQDDFGEERKDQETRAARGRVLMRHKHVLPDDWQAQFELSYLCDRNYLEADYPDEFEAGKEQETLIYARKQRDNWVLTSLLQARLNRFQTQTESFPEVAFHLIGQPLWQDRLTFFSESRIGAKRWRPSNQIKTEEDSDIFARLDTRNELNLPLKVGPINVVPYLTTRLTYWGDHPAGGRNFRPMLSAGVKANTLIWAVHNDVHSRFWDLNTIRHEIKPEVVAFAGATDGWDTDEAYPMDPDIEGVARLSGVSVGVHQRWQTKRGGGKDRPPAIVDWMRLSVVGTFYSTKSHQPPADGRLFWYRPENSIGSNHINVDYEWNISDSTVLLADMNIDVDDAEIGRSGIALAVSRDPRLKYFFGLRTIRELDTILGTFGIRYQINRKYSVSFLEQYDFDFDGGENQITQISIVRKLPRWFVGFTVQFDQRQDDLTFMITLWPEGIPETQIRSGRLKPFASSSKN